MHLWYFLSLTIAAMLTGVADSASLTRPKGDRKPNIIFIVADDLGWGDLQCYGNPYIETPAINRLAAEGIRLSDYYSPSPLCAPARAALLTGRFNHRTGAIDVSSNLGIDRIAHSELTMGDYFRHAGYATALIGKWHNGLYNESYLPYRRGFDQFYGFANGGQDYYRWNLMRNGTQVQHDGRYLTDALNEEAIRFIELHRNRPFFLFLSHHAPHPPLQAPDSLVHKYMRKMGKAATEEAAVVYAMIEAMDRGIGKLIDRVEELGLQKNTLIVFTSDNGAFFYNKERPRYHGPFSGEKGNVLEQGIRVPAIVSWKGTIPAGRVVSTPVHGCDWLPTLFSLTGAPTPAKAKPLDGENLFPLFSGHDMPAVEGRKLFFQKNRYTPVAHSNGSVRMGSWKLYWPPIGPTMRKDMINDNPSYTRGLMHPHWEMPLDTVLPSLETLDQTPPKLFNLAADPSEQYDLAGSHPQVVRELTEAYSAWFTELMNEWKRSWQEIKAQDKVYWKNRPVPDPRKLFDGFWEWERSGLDSAAADPLEAFKGYW